jgi:translation initiation factor 4A
MELRENVLRGVFAYGFEKPSIIQQKAIVPFARGYDLVAQAQSGTGKTGTYSIGMLERLDYSTKDCQALVLTPTRELATQVQRIVSALGDYLNAVCHACVGGVRTSVDIEALKRGVHIVVGTPGRVRDLIERGALDTSTLRVLIFDEADEMLSRGFEDDIREIVRRIPLSTQVGLFSATFPEEILDITQKIVRDPVKIICKKEELPLQGIYQFHVNVQAEKWKLATLCDLFNDISVNQCIIFCNKKETVEWVADRMIEDGFPVSALHAQKEGRIELMEKFRTGSTRVLITTDLLARGLDIQQVSAVINYDLPHEKENYLHRIGRCGRFGRKGLAVNIVTDRTLPALRDLERFYATHIPELPGNIRDLI